MTSQIIAFGGGGFSTESEPGLDEYLLQQCSSSNPRIGFIGTASGDSDRYRLRFYARFSQLVCRPSHLEFFGRTPDLEDWAMSQDLIFVGGGNTKSMLAVWRDWGFDQSIKRAYQSGIVLAGISAGAICWYESGLTDSYADDLVSIQGLGLLKGSCCPHYNEERERRPKYLALIGDEQIADGVAIDDRCAVHYVDGVLNRVIKGRPEVSAYSVTHENGGAVEAEIAGAEVIRA